MGKTKKYTFIKSDISKKFYESYKSVTNYQKNSNRKDKIKSNVHFGNTFTVNE